MTVSLKHAFTSAKADGTDSTLVQPSNWNAEHTLTLAAGKVLGRDSSGTGAAQELPLSFDSTLQSMIPPSGTTAQRPGTPAAGMIRYNTSLSKLELYAGSTWGSVGGGCTISDTAPAGPAAGDLWWKSDEGQMYVYYNDGTSNQWVVANAFTGASSIFLPLTGGTLTGNLNGTTATFSGTLTGAAATLSGTLTANGTVAATKNAYASIIALTDGATITPDFSLGNNFSVTLGGNRTLANPTGLTAGQSGVVYIAQDATGSRTLSWGAYWKFPSGTAPTLTTTASAVDAVFYTVRSSTSITVNSLLNIA